MVEQTRGDDGRSATAGPPTLVQFTRDGGARAGQPSSDRWHPEADWDTGGVVPVTAQRRPWAWWTGAVLSVAWLGAVGAYGWGVVGLAALQALAPMEAAALVGGAFVPLAFLWMVVAFSDRGAVQRAEMQALRRHLALLAYPAEAAQERITTISDVLRTQTRELAQATREAGNQAETLRLLLTRETAELRGLVGEIDGSAAQSVSAAAERVEDLRALMDTVSTLGRDLEQAMGRQHGALAEASGLAGRAAARLEHALGTQVQGLTAAAAAVAAQVAAAEAAAVRHADLVADADATTSAFTHAAETLASRVSDALHGLTLRTTALAEEQGKVGKGAVALAGDLRDATDRLVTLGETVMQRAETLEDVNRRLTDTGHAAAQELDAATAAALGDFNAFRDASAEAISGARSAAAAVRDASAQGEAAQRLLQTQARGLEQAVRTLGEEVRGTGLALDEQAQAIAQTTERSAERIRHLAELLSRNAVDITRTTARAVVEIETVSEELKSGSGDVRAVVENLREAGQAVERVTEDALERVSGVGAGMAEGCQAVRAAAADFAAEGSNLAALANDTVQALSVLGDELRSEAGGMGRAAGTALSEAGALRDELTAVLAGFEDGVARGTGEVDRAGEKLRLAAEVFESTATHAGGAMAERADELEERLRGLEATVLRVRGGVEDAAGALENHAGLLDAAGRRGVDNARRAVAELGQQVEQIVTVTRTAEQRTRELNTAREAVDVQRFLTDTSFVLERLQATAVDITRLFSPGVEDDLWKRYYKGEQNVFLRHAARTITRGQSAAVRKLFTQDGEFRGYVERYMGEFEALLRAARTNDRADVLTAVFTSSDMGRLYMVLARALNRGTVK